jgi:hypothetical protein
MPVKVHFDIELSKKLCPPKDPTDRFGKKIGRFIKRIVIKKDLVSYDKDANPRVHNIKPENVIKIRDSFEVNGFIPTEYPPGIEVDPNDSNRYVGLSGFNRDEAASALGWDVMLYDVYEFDSPKARRIYRSASNQHRTPHTDMTKSDIAKEVNLAIRNKEIPNDESSILEFVEELAADKTEQIRNTIFKTVMKANGSSDNIRLYHDSGSGEASLLKLADELNLPVKGDKRYRQTNKLGYLISNATQKTTLYDAKKLSQSYDWENIEFRAHIEEAKETPAIYKQREDWQQKYNNFLRVDAEFVQEVMKRCGFNCDIDSILEKYPFQFKGFAPQVITPDANKGGRPTEETIVDAYGKEISVG